MNFDPLSLEEIIASIFAVDDHYYLCGSPTEFNEVLSGGAFWVHPQLLKPEQARELLQGREAEAVRRGAALFAGGALRPA